MANDFGLRVGVDGESEFKRALADINSSMKTLGTEAKLVQSQYDATDKSTEALAAQTSVLNKQIAEQTKKVALLKDALENAKKEFGENSRQAQSWQQKLNIAEAELNEMNRELDKTSEKTEKSSADFSKFGSVLQSVGAGFAAVTAAAGAAVIGLGKALVDFTTAGAEYSDNIMTQSKVTGIATDKLQEYAYAAEIVDVSVDTITSTLKKNTMSMKNAAKGSADVSLAYAKLGIKVRSANGELRDSEEVYWELIDALGKIQNETERDALAMTLLGKSATDLNPLIKAGSAAMKELGNEAQQAGYVLSDELLQKYNALDDATNKLSAGATAAKNALGGILLPVLTNLAENGTDLLGKFTNAINEADGDITQMAENIQELVPDLIQIINENLPQLLTLLTSVIDALISVIAAALPQIINAVQSLIPGIIQTIVGLLPSLAQAVLTLVESLIETFVEVAPELLGAIKSVIGQVLIMLPGILKTIIVAIGDLLPEIVTTITELIPMVSECIIQLTEMVIDTLPSVISKLIEALPTILPPLVKAITETIPVFLKTNIMIIDAIVEALPDIITSLLLALPDILSGIIDVVIDLLPEIIEGITILVGKIIKSLPQIFVKLGEKLAECGGEIMEGLWSGIKKTAVNLWNNVDDVFGGFVNGVKDFFGIHSPSTLFEEIGVNMGLGLEEGFVDTMKDAEREMQNSIPNDFDVNTTYTATAGISPGMQEEIMLLREQNNLLQLILEKDLNITLSDEAVGLSNARYVQKRGVVLNQGVYANAY